MYKIYVNNELFCDSRIDELAIINPVVNLEVNTAGSFSFTVAPDHPYYDKVQKRKSIISVYRDEETEPTFQGICTEEKIDFYRQKKVTCEGELTYLNDSILRPQRYQNVTVLTLLTSYIEQHNAQVEEYKRFEIGTVTVTDPNNYIFCYTNMNPTLKEIKEDLLDDLGGYLRVRYENGHKYIDYLAESTRYAEQVIELGKNLIDYESNLSTTDIATRLIPLGARLEEQVIEGLETRLTIESVNDGKDYLQSDAAVEEYGIITKTVEFDGINTPSLLKTRGEQYLSEVQFENVVIEVKAVDFGYIANSIDKFRLMDNIKTISRPHGMDKWSMLSKMTLKLNDPDKDVFVLGKKEKKSLTVKTIQSSQEIIKQVNNMPSSSEMLQAIAQATALIKGVEGGHFVINTDENGYPYEWLVMDTDNKETAQKVIRCNLNGIGFSKTGYYGTYETAWTIDGGFVADYITSGTMSADRIRGGSIEGVTVTGSTIIADKELDLKASNGTQYKVIEEGVRLNDTFVNSMIRFDDGSYDRGWIGYTVDQEHYENVGNCVKIGAPQLTYFPNKVYMNKLSVGDMYINRLLVDGVLAVSNLMQAPNICVYDGEGGVNLALNSSRQLCFLQTRTTEDFATCRAWNFASGASSKLAKENIENLAEEDAKKLLDITPVEFDYIKSFSGRHSVGLIAEEVIDVMGEIPAVIIPEGYDPNEFDPQKGAIQNKTITLDYTMFVPYLIKLCQMQQEEIDELKAIVKEIKEAM